MIATLRGEVRLKYEDTVILDVRGKGYQVRMPTPFFAKVKLGQELFCYTHLMVRKTKWFFFGFETAVEADLFKLLLTVQKVNPRIALAALSTIDPHFLAGAITKKRADLLTRVPGIGIKMAQRIVLELKGKVDKYAIGVLPEAHPDHVEAISALMALAYTRAEAQDALKDLDSNLPLDEKVFTALQRLNP